MVKVRYEQSDDEEEDEPKKKRHKKGMLDLHSLIKTLDLTKAEKQQHVDKCLAEVFHDSRQAHDETVY